MHIVNMMLSRARGGLEQSAVDYAEMMRHRHIQVTSIIASDCAYEKQVKDASAKTFLLDNKGPWDFMAPRRLKAMLVKANPDGIICHGNRAFTMARRMGARRTPIIVVTHNTKIKPLKKADAVFAVTKRMHGLTLNHGVQGDRLHYVPNMARVPMQPPVYRHYQEPLVIGSLSRLAEEKGVDILLEGFAILKEDPSVPAIRLLIGGDGPERKALGKKAQKLGLTKKDVTFAGWIEHSGDFFRKLDIYCLPSRRETFGISLVEAMGRGLPCVATNCDGPQEILTHNKNGFLIQRDDPQGLAHTLLAVIKKTENERTELSRNAFDKASEYNIANVSAELHTALTAVVGDND